MQADFQRLAEVNPCLEETNNINHLGTLGSGNHFIELCLDERENVWLMLHSGSRGVGNKIDSHFIELAKKDMEKQMIHLPDNNLAYFSEGSEHFDEYVFTVEWAQSFARIQPGIKDSGVIDETPAAYKDIDQVMAS